MGKESWSFSPSAIMTILLGMASSYLLSILLKGNDTIFNRNISIKFSKSLKLKLL